MMNLNVYCAGGIQFLNTTYLRVLMFYHVKVILTVTRACFYLHATVIRRTRKQSLCII